MNDISQIIKGHHNCQNINIFNTEPSDIIPQDIEYILDFINDNIFEEEEKHPIVIPDLLLKNKLNGIDINQYNLMKQDFSSFEEIEDSIINDISGILKNKYYKAAKILNIKYMANYQDKFPKFTIDIMSLYSKNKKFDDSKIIKLYKLLNYMYCQCDLGIKP